MAVDIKVPSLGESVTEATVGKWFKAAGDAVKVDEPLCELETDKVTVEVPSPVSGVLSEIKVAEGTTVAVGAVLGSVKEGAAATTSSQPAAKSEAQTPKPQPAAAAKEQTAAAARPVETIARGAATGDMPPAPSARKMMEESGIAVGDVQGSGRRGQVLKEDVATAVSSRSSAPAVSQATAPVVSTIQVPVAAQQMRAPSLPQRRRA